MQTMWHLIKLVKGYNRNVLFKITDTANIGSVWQMKDIRSLSNKPIKNNISKEPSEDKPTNDVRKLANDVSKLFHPNPMDRKNRKEISSELVAKLADLSTKSNLNKHKSLGLSQNNTPNRQKFQQPQPHHTNIKLDPHNMGEEIIYQHEKHLNYQTSTVTRASWDSLIKMIQKPELHRPILLNKDGSKPKFADYSNTHATEKDFTALDWLKRFKETDSIDAESDNVADNTYLRLLKLQQEGKMWSFPINNEVGMDIEETTPFYEHVFLHKHLESFPKRGAIRLFMESVVIGLSNNSWLTVEEKKEYINWFREYFKEKYEILLQLGAVQDKDLFEPSIANDKK